MDIAAPPQGEGPAPWSGERGGDRQHLGGALGTHASYSAVTPGGQAPLTWDLIDTITGGSDGEYRSTCPLCSENRSTPAHRAEEVLGLSRTGTFAKFNCFHCGAHGSATENRESRPRHRALVRPQTPRPDPKSDGLNLWHQAREPADTPVEIYLQHRGLSLPPEAGDVLRWHPDCPFGKGRTGCMIALVRSVLTDEPIGIHRTAISKTGEKVIVGGASRRALGPIKGGAIKLGNDADVGPCLGVGEGIETTLSIRLHPQFTGVPVWALIDANHMRDFPPLAGIEGLVIAVDNDASGTGDAAAQALSARYGAAGVAVTLLRAPQVGADLNDLVGAA